MIKTYCDRCGNLIDTRFYDCINIRKCVAPMSSAADTTHYITSGERFNKSYDLCTGCFTVFVNDFMSNVKGEKE